LPFYHRCTLPLPRWRPPPSAGLLRRAPGGGAWRLDTLSSILPLIPKKTSPRSPTGVDSGAGKTLRAGHRTAAGPGPPPSPRPSAGDPEDSPGYRWGRRGLGPSPPRPRPASRSARRGPSALNPRCPLCLPLPPLHRPQLPGGRHLKTSVGHDIPTSSGVGNHMEILCQKLDTYHYRQKRLISLCLPGYEWISDERISRI